MPNNVVITMSVEQQAAVRAWQKMETAADKLGKKLKAIDNTGGNAFRGMTLPKEAASGFDGLTASMGKTLLKFSAFAIGLQTLKAGIAAVADENKRFIASLDEVVAKRSEEELKLMIQGGLTPAEVEAQMPQIKKALLSTPSTDVSGALKLQTQAASSGFRPEDVESGLALQALLNLKAATNAYGEDMGNEKEAVQGISRFLKATGVKEPSAADIETEGAELTQLFKASDIQFKDMTELAGEAATLHQAGMSRRQQKAAFATMVDAKMGAEAATGLRMMVASLTTHGASKEQTEILKSMGIDPKEIDMVGEGENFVQAARRLSEGLQKLPEEDRANALEKLYGSKGRTAAAFFTDPATLAVVEKYDHIQGSTEEYENNLKRFRASRYAVSARAKAEKEFDLRDEDRNRGQLTWTELKEQQDKVQAAQMKGKTVGQRVYLSIGHATANYLQEKAKGFGLSPGDLGFERSLDEDRALPAPITEGAAKARRDPRAATENAFSNFRSFQKQVGSFGEGPRSAEDAAMLQDAGKRTRASVEALPAGPDRDRLLAQLEPTLKEMTVALRENTAATRGNSVAAAGGPKTKAKLVSSGLDRRR